MPDLAARLDAMADGMREYPSMRTTDTEIDNVREAAAEIRRLRAEIARLTARCNHMESQWTGTLTGEIQTQQTSDYERARAIAEGRINQAMATWDRLWREGKADA